MCVECVEEQTSAEVQKAFVLYIITETAGKAGGKGKMKNFILGMIVALIIGSWITLAVVGVISVKTAILVPAGIVIGLLISVWLFGLFWDS